MNSVAQALMTPHPILLKFILLCALVSSPTILSLLLCFCPIPSYSAPLFKVNHRGPPLPLSVLNFPVFPLGESLALLYAGLPTAASATEGLMQGWQLPDARRAQFMFCGHPKFFFS